MIKVQAAIRLATAFICIHSAISATSAATSTIDLSKVAFIPVDAFPSSSNRSLGLPKDKLVDHVASRVTLASNVGKSAPDDSLRYDTLTAPANRSLPHEDSDLLKRRHLYRKTTIDVLR